MRLVDVSNGDESEGWEGRVFVLEAAVTALRMVVPSRWLSAGTGFVSYACLAVPTDVARFVAIPTMLAGLLCHIVSARCVARIVGMKGCKR